MPSTSPSLENRSMSGFPISIGTSLALETIFDPVQPVYDESRTVPNKIEPSSYNLYLFNIATLLRNLLGSLNETNDIFRLKNKDILDALLEEIDWLSNFFQHSGLGASFYIHNYNYPKNTYKDKLRKITTERQLRTEDIFKYCLDKLAKEDDVKVFSKYIHYDKQDTALIMTHVPWDLLSHSNFLKLDLLESHTGVVKTRKDWYTKYYKLPGERDMSFLPFIEYLLTVFGDNVMFKPEKLEKRLEIYNSLSKKNVHSLMTEFTMLTLLGK